MKIWFLIVPLGLAALVGQFFWSPFYIPSGSMKPTLLVGDFINVLPIRDDPKRGDILVFDHPNNGNTFIQRLIGMPGDRVQMRDGQLLINDTYVDLQDAGSFIETMEMQGPAATMPRCIMPTNVGQDCEKWLQRETLPNGRQYDVLDIGSYPADNTGVFTVPLGQYFLLGDNRDNSTDSRFPVIQGGVGFVPAENIRGRAAIVVFSSAGQSMSDTWTWRPDRYFKRIE